MEDKSKRLLILLFIILGFSLIFGLFLIFKKNPKKANEALKDVKVESAEAREEENKIEDQYRIEKEDDKSIEYNQDDLRTAYYSNKKSQVLPDQRAKQMEIFLLNNLEKFQFEGLDEKIFEESKKFNSDANKYFKNKVLTLVEDINVIQSLPDSYLSNKDITRDNLSAIKNDKAYICGILSMDQDYRTEYTQDDKSAAYSISKEMTDKFKNPIKIISEVEEEPEDSPEYKRAKEVYFDDPIKDIKSAKFEYEKQKFKFVFLETQTGKRIFIGFYPLSKPMSEYSSVAKWRLLVKNKRDMRDPATSIWQEGGPQGIAENPLKEATDDYKHDGPTSSELQEESPDSVITPGTMPGLYGADE